MDIVLSSNDYCPTKSNPNSLVSTSTSNPERGKRLAGAYLQPYTHTHELQNAGGRKKKIRRMMIRRGKKRPKLKANIFRNRYVSVEVNLDLLLYGCLE